MARHGAAQSVDVVGVEVGEHHGVEGGDTEIGQAAVDQRGVGACVDEDGPVRAAAQHDGVTLADVADDDPPTVGWPGQRAGRKQRRRDDQRRAEGEHRVGRDPRRQRASGEEHGRVRAPRSSAPGAPSGQGSVPPGTSANRRAICAMAMVGSTPAHARSSARGSTAPR